MAKPDIRAAQLAWHEYKDKPADQAIQSVYERALQASLHFTNWYWTSIGVKRQTSIGVRAATFILLIVGTLFPLLAGLYSDPTQRLTLTQFGIVALALSGLLQIADKVFGWSSGWLRYIATATAMENVVQKFQQDWSGYIIDRSGHVGDSDVKPLFELGNLMLQDLAKLQTEETDKWIADFNSGAALLGEMIKSQRESGDRAAQAHAAAAEAHKALLEAAGKTKLSGAVELTITYKAAPVPVQVSLDGGDAQKDIVGGWSRLGLAPGLHELGVIAAGTPPFHFRKVFEVPAGGIAQVAVSI